MLDVEGGDGVGPRREVQRVVALLQVDGHAGDVVEQRQRVVGRRSAVEVIAGADVLDVGQAERVGSGRDLQGVVAGAEIDGEAVLVVGQRVEIVGRAADQMLDVVERGVDERACRGAACRCRRRGRSTGRCSARKSPFADRQGVVRRGAVDGVDVEDVGERIGAGRQVQRVDAVGEIDRQAADVVEQRQRVVGGGAGGEIAAVEDLDVGHAERVRAVGEVDVVVAAAHVDGQAVDVVDEADEIVAAGADQVLDVGEVEGVAAGLAENDGVVRTGAEVDQVARQA